MASMLRPGGKATKIAYAILGTPINMVKAKKYRQKKQLSDDQLLS